MVALCRAGCQRAQLAGVALVVMFVTLLVLHPQRVSFTRRQIPIARVVGQRSAELETVPSAVSAGEPTGPQSTVDALKRTCSKMASSAAGTTADILHVMRWVCKEIGAEIPQKLDVIGCNKSLSYQPIGRLGNLIGLYSIVFSFGKMFGATSYVEPGMWKALHKYFPHISLQPTSKLPAVAWEDITYQQARDKLTCRPGDAHDAPRFFRITNYPDRNGIDVFHPFYTDLSLEFQFSPELQQQAHDFLHYAQGSRASATFVGFHIRRTDYARYINTSYNNSLPDELYFSKALTFYRSRFADALFIVCSDDMKYVEKALKASQHDDIVIAGNRNIEDPGRDMALLSACNHSVVTVGTYGFWGAYLAGGTVLVPELQTHLSMGDRHAPLLEIQLAGADNWIAIR